MESENHRIIKNFLLSWESQSIIDWVDSIKYEQTVDNRHIKEVRKSLNGSSYMFDVSRTEQTKYITNFQSSGNVINEDVPLIIKQLIHRISFVTGISDEHVFLQAIDMAKGGKVSKHYDSAINGFINYKCNVSVLSEDYDFVVDKDTMHIEQGDLYCFEASLYKHWTKLPFNSRRVLLSFGFLLPYSELGRSEEDPRVRLSKRLEKYFQGS